MSRGADAPRESITGVVLAGGRATRMGGVDKGLVPVAGRPMVAWVIDAIRPQVGPLLINANRNLEAYAALGWAVIGDGDDDYRGPLAGIASGLAAARTDWVLTVPCDSPLVAADLATRLYRAAASANQPVGVAHDGDRLQPVFALIRRALAATLTAYLDGGGRRVDGWFDRCGYAAADCRDVAGSFANVNTPDDVSALELRLELQAGDHVQRHSQGDRSDE